MKQVKIILYGSRPSGRISAPQAVVLEVLAYFTAARNDPCPEAKNAPKWG
jgi:hypothetical protein